MSKNNEANKLRIEQVLASFKIGHGEIIVTPGPTVTLYEFKPSVGVRASKIRNLKDEFSMALEVNSVRVIAPTERGTVGIEVPNSDRDNIGMMEMLYSDEYMETNMELPLVIGKKVDNSVFMADLATMPHLLVAGATGMGKSVGLNVIISSLLNKLTPDELKLVLVDPKQVELSIYDTIAKPYLAHLKGLPPISTTPEEAKQTLDAVIRLMESRYTVLKDAGVRNIQDYNGLSGVKSLPYYVIVIDEYGDLILQGSKEMENAICRIAQKARAVGIHMIISTQRPDTKIVTGNIKANFPTRIAFRTTTGTDSRVILDRIGAERLTGRGDMLFFNGGDSTRVQCAYISTEEVNEMCHEMAEEWSGCDETFLPDEQVVTPNKPQLLVETLQMIYKLPNMTEMPHLYGSSKLIKPVEWEVLHQLYDIGCVKNKIRYNKNLECAEWVDVVVMHNIEEILQRAKAIFA